MDSVVRAMLLAVALFSVMLAKGLSASPQHSMYLGCLDLEVKVPPPVPMTWLQVDPVTDPDPDLMDAVLSLLELLAPPWEQVPFPLPLDKLES